MPTTPFGSVAGVTVTVGQLVEKVRFTLPVQVFTSEAMTLMLNVPDSVGVPESVAVAGLNVIPAGSAPLCSQVITPIPPI